MTMEISFQGLITSREQPLFNIPSFSPPHHPTQGKFITKDKNGKIAQMPLFFHKVKKSHGKQQPHLPQPLPTPRSFSPTKGHAGSMTRGNCILSWVGAGSFYLLAGPCWRIDCKCSIKQMLLTEEDLAKPKEAGFLF